MNYRGKVVEAMILNFWHDDGKATLSGRTGVALLQRLWGIFDNLTFLLTCTQSDDLVAHKYDRESEVLRDLAKYTAPEYDWRIDDQSSIFAYAHLPGPMGRCRERLDAVWNSAEGRRQKQLSHNALLSLVQRKFLEGRGSSRLNKAL